MSMRPVPHPAVTMEKLDGEICLYRASDHEVLVLNQSAGDIWRLADGDLTVDEITVLLSSAYSADEQLVAQDVRNTVAELQERGFFAEGLSESSN